MATIFHLALASDWAEAQASGSYTVSTRGRTLAEEGFIHASRGDQWPAVRERFYADITAPLVLLQIDTERLGVPVVEEPAEPGATETFPHIYGPLPVAAVVKVVPLDGGTSPLTPATLATPATATPARPSGSFTETYFREMLVNAGLVLLVMLCGVIGAGIGAAIDGGDSGLRGVLGLAGVLVGGVVAVVLYRRRA